MRNTQTSPAAGAAPLTCVVGLLGGLVIATPSATASAAPPESTIEEPSVEPISVHIEIVADTLSSAMRAEVVADIEKQFAEIAASHGLVKASSPAADLVIRLEFSQPDPKARVFVTHALALYEGDVLQRDQARTCVQCTASEIAADGLKILIPTAEEVGRRRAEAAAQRQAELEAAEPAPVVEAPPPPTVHPIGPIGYVGIASSAVGLGTAIAGVVLLNRGRILSADGLFVTDYRSPGRPLTGVGLGLMVLGNVLLASDLAVLTPRRQSRARAKMSAITFVAEPGPGIVVAGRF